jgi:ribosomal protein L40E
MIYGVLIHQLPVLYLIFVIQSIVESSAIKRDGRVNQAAPASRGRKIEKKREQPHEGQDSVYYGGPESYPQTPEETAYQQDVPQFAHGSDMYRDQRGFGAQSVPQNRMNPAQGYGNAYQPQSFDGQFSYQNNSLRDAGTASFGTVSAAADTKAGAFNASPVDAAGASTESVKEKADSVVSAAARTFDLGGVAGEVKDSADEAKETPDPAKEAINLAKNTADEHESRETEVPRIQPEIVNTGVCKKCGCRLEVGALFCMNCGTRVSQD